MSKKLYIINDTMHLIYKDYPHIPRRSYPKARKSVNMKNMHRKGNE